MAPLVGIGARFHQLPYLQEVTQLLILVDRQCYSCLLGRHSQFSTLCTKPFSSQYVSMTLHMGQSSLMVFATCKITISPTFKFLLMFVNLFISWSDCKNSFFQRHQNSFTMCWTCLHLLRLYKSGLEKSPGGGKVIFDFMVKRFDGERDKLLVRSLMLSVFKGWEFKFPSVSVISVASDSSSSDLPWFTSKKTG